MQQIINYIIKNSTRLLFLLFLGISLFLTIQSHSYHRSRTISSANVITGNVYEQLNNFNEYLNLKHENEILAKENAWLKKMIYNKSDTILTKNIVSGDSIYRSFNVIQSKIIKNIYNSPDNYLTINSGKKHGIKPFMGVINSEGVIGVVDVVTDNFATIISVLNTKSEINAKLKNSNHFGTLKWNAKSTGFVQLIDVPRLANVRKGDTIVTGAQSSIFPEGILIGTIEKLYVDNKTNYFTIDVKLFNDMTNIGHVYVIENKKRAEILSLEAPPQ
ncbi:MAG: rod shape-determining protein MreC [Flavobacterium sp.]|jgi:rod shape-determining protein MreC